MNKDPVCGMNVNPEFAVARSEYKGKTYYFCSPLCKNMFEREPVKYINPDKAESE